MFPNSPDRPSDQQLTDKHAIDTPEQMALEFTVAGIGSRFLAMAVDTLVQAGITIALFIIIAILGVGGALAGLKRQPSWIFALMVAFVFLVSFGYFAAFEILWNGQTPGKRVAKIRVVKDSGRPLTAAEAIARNLLRIVDQLPAMYAVGITVALTNAQNKRLGDFIAGSIVVREGSLAEVKPVWQAGEVAAAPADQAIGAAALTVDDVLLIDTFLNRRYDLAPDVRARMAAEILEKLRPKLSLPPQVEGTAECILEALAYQRRSTGAYS